MKKFVIPLFCSSLFLISCNSETIFQEDFETETINQPTDTNPDGDPADDKIKINAGSGIVKADPGNNQNRMLSISNSNIEFLTGGFPHENKKYLVLFSMIADIVEGDFILISLNSQNSQISNLLTIDPTHISGAGSDESWTHTPGQKFSVILAIDAEAKTYSIAIGNNSPVLFIEDQPFINEDFDELKGMAVISSTSTAGKNCLIDDITILKNKTMEDSDDVSD